MFKIPYLVGEGDAEATCADLNRKGVSYSHACKSVILNSNCVFACILAYFFKILNNPDVNAFIFFRYFICLHSKPTCLHSVCDFDCVIVCEVITCYK